MAVSVTALTVCPLFQTVSPAALQFAAANMSLLHLRRRQVLGGVDVQDAPFDGLGVVLQGGLQATDLLLDGKEVALASAATLEPFGHTTLLAQQPLVLTWSATASPTTIAVMGREHALQLLGFAEVMAAFARLNAQQLCDLLGLQRIQSVHPVSARVCAWLLHQERGQGTFTLPTHAEMAGRLNTTRESVTRVLQKLLNDSVLRRDGDTWHLLERPTLLEMSKGD